MEQMETQLLSNYSREGGEGERDGGSRYTVIRYINTLYLIFFSPPSSGPLSSLLTVGRVPLINVLESSVSPPPNYRLISSDDQESLFHTRQQALFDSSSLLKDGDCSG